MIRVLACVVTLVCISLPAAAGDLQRDLKSRWLGAWVVTTVDSRSDCGGMYTNNRIHGRLVKSKGIHRFALGELAQVDRVDVKKSRLDLHLSFPEPVLVPYEEGPFTLYRESSCRIELEVTLPRDVVKGKDGGAVDEAIRRVVKRYEAESEARGSEAWNARARDSYPDDYDVTLARLATWRAKQTNAAVQSRLDRARDETVRVSDSLDSDPSYLEGFAQGIDKARARSLEECSSLVAIDLDKIVGSRRDYDSPEQARHHRGYKDAQVLVLGLEQIQRLPRCFVDVPRSPDHEVASGE